MSPTLKRSQLARGSAAQVSAGALVHNLKVARRHAGDAEVLCVVKADAYGHGAARVATVLQAEGVERFGVATVEEGLELREAGITGTILLLGGASWWGAPDLLVEGDLVPVLSSVEELAELEAHMRAHHPERTLCAHLKLDTGMGRVGLVLTGETEGDLRELLDVAKTCERVALTGACTHFANADAADDAATARQAERFEAALRVLRKGGLPLEVVHLSNSAALLSLGAIADDMGLDAWARAGLLLYGYSPLPDERLQDELLPALSWTAPVVVRKRLPAGATVSYGSTFTTTRETEIAVLGVGYADGYLRALSGKACVRFGDLEAPLLGRVCMDLVVVDVTEVVTKAGAQACALGARATLLGDGLNAWRLARWADTIAYEILTRIGRRVPRILTHEEP